MFRRMHFAPEGEVATGGGAAVTAATAPAVATTAATATTTDAEPHWLPARLERERVAAEKNARAALLKEIGVSDPAAAAKLVADEQARIAAAKTLETKVSEGETALAAERARVVALSGTVAAIANERMTGLTDAQRAAVKAIAGDDAQAQLNAIAALAPTWGSPTTQTAAATTATTTTVATAKPVPPASGTAPPAAAPAAATAVSQVDHKAEYASLKKSNPHAAALYLNKHHAAIYPSS